MSEEELSQLLKISYSNNNAINSIDQKIRDNEEIIDDLNVLLNMRDPKAVWAQTTLNMVIASGLFTGMSKLVFDISDKDLRFMLLSLSIGCVTLGYIKYKEEVIKQKKIRKEASKDDRINKVCLYTNTQLDDLKKEQKALKDVKKQIVDRETELRQVFANKEKKLVK